MNRHMVAERHGWVSEGTVRTAQRRAFDRMLAASESDEMAHVVQEAVQELLDACEAYIAAR